MNAHLVRFKYAATVCQTVRVRDPSITVGDDWLGLSGDIFGNEPVEQLIVKQSVIFILTQSGRVVLWDQNWEQGSWSMVGGIIMDRCVKELQFDHGCALSDRVTGMEVSDTACFFVCASGAVFVMGTNNANCLGLRYPCFERITKPMLMDPLLLKNEKCIRIVCAGLSTRFVTVPRYQGFSSYGHNIYSCGMNSRGEGAVGGIVPRELTSPVQVHSLLLQNELIHKIVAGNHSYMMLTESGRVLVNGSNAGNQLFKTGTTALISQLVEVKCSCIVRDIASRSNSFAMLQGGKLRTSSKFFAGPINFGCNPVNFAHIYASSTTFVAVTGDNDVYLVDGDETEGAKLDLWPRKMLDKYEVSFSSSSVLSVFYCILSKNAVARSFPRMNQFVESESLSDIMFVLQN